jgi:hypothetical protein
LRGIRGIGPRPDHYLTDPCAIAPTVAMKIDSITESGRTRPVLKDPARLEARTSQPVMCAFPYGWAAETVIRPMRNHGDDNLAVFDDDGVDVCAVPPPEPCRLPRGGFSAGLPRAVSRGRRSRQAEAGNPSLAAQGYPRPGAMPACVSSTR